MQKQSFNHTWRFHLGDAPTWEGPRLDDTWRTVDLPHDWSIELDRDPNAPNGVSVGFFPMGRGYYHKSFHVPEEWRGKRILVEFEGVYMNAAVWLNDDFLGRHPYGYTSFVFDLTPYLKIGQDNALRVKVDNSHQGNSRWYSGSGIYRPVWLYVAEPVHIAHWSTVITTPKVSKDRAAVQIRTRVVNETGAGQTAAVTFRLIGPDQRTLAAEAGGSIATGKERDFTASLDVPRPFLWSPETPNLYRLESVVQVNGKVVDAETTTFGIRSLELSAEKGFLLNGESIKMKGGCVHHDNGVLGAASFPRSEERKVELLKAAGYNTVRCAHNPPAPSFLDACDRLGMLVVDETFDCWREGKNPGDYHLAFDDWWERDIESMVLRDRNHPSVVLWSIGNEVHERDGRSDGGNTARKLAEKVHKLDPTRPVTAGICGPWSEGRKWEDMDAVFAQMDIAGYNYQWKMYAGDHERHPERIMLGTESFPLEAFENWRSVLELPYVIGDCVWTSMDYLGESGIGRQTFEPDKDTLGKFPWHQAFCGDIDLAGFKRPQSYYRDVVWGNGEKLYLAVHYPVPEGKTPKVTRWGWPDVDANWTWPGEEGRVFQVDVYSACEKAELFLNGRSLGVKPTTKAEKCIARFEVPYEPGELKAVGYDGNRSIAETALTTVGAPAALRLRPDRGAIQGDSWDLCYVTVEVVDAQGRRHPSADHDISFSVQGASKIAAVGSGNPTTTERYRGARRKAYRGRCVVVVKSTGQAGEVRLRAQAEGLSAAELAIRAE